MISISRRYHFEAAHRLPNVPDGHKCKNMHGHNYQVVVTVNGKGPHAGLRDDGMVMDFAALDTVVEPLLRLLDHSVLNDTIPNPTAEMIAIWIAAGVVMADAVRVYETSECWAEWRRVDNDRHG